MANFRFRIGVPGVWRRASAFQVARVRTSKPLGRYHPGGLDSSPPLDPMSVEASVGGDWWGE